MAEERRLFAPVRIPVAAPGAAAPRYTPLEIPIQRTDNVAQDRVSQLLATYPTTVYGLGTREAAAMQQQAQTRENLVFRDPINGDVLVNRPMHGQHGHYEQQQPALQYNVPVNPDSGLGSSYMSQRQITEWMLVAFLDYYLYKRKFCTILRYIVVENGRARFVRSKEEYKANKLCSDTKPIISIKAEFIESKYLTVERMRSVLARYLKKTGLVWYELTKYHEMIAKHVRDVLEEEFAVEVGFRSDELHDEFDDIVRRRHRRRKHRDDDLDRRDLNSSFLRDAQPPAERNARTTNAKPTANEDDDVMDFPVRLNR